MVTAVNHIGHCHTINKFDSVKTSCIWFRLFLSINWLQSENFRWGWGSRVLVRFATCFSLYDPLLYLNTLSTYSFHNHPKVEGDDVFPSHHSDFGHSLKITAGCSHQRHQTSAFVQKNANLTVGVSLDCKWKPTTTIDGIFSVESTFARERFSHEILSIAVGRRYNGLLLSYA